MAILATSALSASATDDTYPNRPVTYIIPFGDGGESTIAARLQERPFKKLTGQDLVIVNKPGGGGAVIWSALNSMAADGYLIAGINLPHIIVQPAYGASYRTKDIAVVHIFHYTPTAVFVSAKSPIKSLEDFIATARATPGKIHVSGSGRGSANHLAKAQFNKLAKVKTTYEAFKGTAASIAALLEGRVDAAMAYTTVAVKYGDDVRMLAMATEERHPQFPDVPTFKELGIDMVDGAYRGIAVPRKTPVEIRRQLSAIFSKINDDEAYRKAQIERGFVPLNIGYDEMAAFMKMHRAQYLDAARDAGLIKDKREARK